MKTNETYIEILNHLTSKDEMREWMTTPFNSNGKTLATNGFAMVAVPEIGVYKDQTEKLRGLYPGVHNMDIVYPVWETLSTAGKRREKTSVSGLNRS